MKTAGHRGRSSLPSLIGSIGLAFLPGALGVPFVDREWYQALDRPRWSPPSAVFGPVWTLLYLARRGRVGGMAPPATAARCTRPLRHPARPEWPVDADLLRCPEAGRSSGRHHHPLDRLARDRDRPVSRPRRRRPVAGPVSRVGRVCHIAERCDLAPLPGCGSTRYGSVAQIQARTTSRSGGRRKGHQACSVTPGDDGSGARDL